MSPEGRAAWEALKASEWFLIRNDGPGGEIWRCKRCRAKHPYLTEMCIERPFNGLMEVVAIIRKAVLYDHAGNEIDAANLTDDASETALAEHENLLKANRLLGAKDLDVAAMVLGSAEPIPADKAKALVFRIELRSHQPVRLDQPDSAEDIQRRLTLTAQDLRQCRCGHTRMTHRDANHAQSCRCVRFNESPITAPMGR